MILCETFWKPSLADFAKQHKQTIYSVFLQVLFLCLVLCFQAPPLLPLSKLLSLCLLAFVSAPSLSFSNIICPLHTPPSWAIPSLGLWFWVEGHGGHGFSTERKKGKKAGGKEWSLLLSLLPLVLRNSVEISIPASIITVGLRQTQCLPQERP